MIAQIKKIITQIMEKWAKAMNGNFNLCNLP